MRLLLYQSLPLRERSGCRNSLSFRASDRRHWRGNPFPAPVGAEHPSPPSVPERLSKGTFRAPARGTFALGGKSTQKRRSNLRFENPSRAFTYRLSRLFSPRERHAAQISSKCCIVSSSLFAAALALKCRAVQLWRKLFLNGGHRPPPTFAAKRQRRDLIIALPGVGVSKGEGRSPPLCVVSRLGDFQGGREIEIPSPLNGVLWLLSFDKERK